MQALMKQMHNWSSSTLPLKEMWKHRMRLVKKLYAPKQNPPTALDRMCIASLTSFPSVPEPGQESRRPGSAQRHQRSTCCRDENHSHVCELNRSWSFVESRMSPCFLNCVPQMFSCIRVTYSKPAMNVSSPMLTIKSNPVLMREQSVSDYAATVPLACICVTVGKQVSASSVSGIVEPLAMI